MIISSLVTFIVYNCNLARYKLYNAVYEIRDSLPWTRSRESLFWFAVKRVDKFRRLLQFELGFLWFTQSAHWLDKADNVFVFLPWNYVLVF